MVNYFDTKKEAEDYLIDIGIREHNLFIRIIYDLIYDTSHVDMLGIITWTVDIGIDEIPYQYPEELKNEKISYEQYELLEEKYPEIVKIDNFFDKINKVNSYDNFIEIFKEDIIKVVLNNKKYYDSIFKFMFSEKFTTKYELYEKPGKLFF